MKHTILFGLVSTLPYLAIAAPKDSAKALDSDRKDVHHHQRAHSLDDDLQKRSSCGNSKSVDIVEPSRGRSKSNAQVGGPKLQQTGRRGSGGTFDPEITKAMTEQERMILIRHPPGQEPTAYKDRYPFRSVD